MGVNQSRVQPGVPQGGQFTTGERAEAADLTPGTLQFQQLWDDQDGSRPVPVWQDSTDPGYRRAVRPGTGEVYLVHETEDTFYLYDRKGRRHADGGRPAVCDADRIAWYVHGQLSREDGPAEILSDGTCNYYSGGAPMRLSADHIDRLRARGLEHVGGATFRSIDEADLFKYGRRDWKADILEEPWPWNPEVDR